MQPGERKVAKYIISSKVYQGFLELFNDHNQLHISDSYAKELGFPSKVMHGNILSGFLSHFVGEIMPAGKCLLQAQELQYKKPCYENNEVEIEGEVIQWVEAVSTVIIKIHIRNLTTNALVAKGKVQVGIL